MSAARLLTHESALTRLDAVIAELSAVRTACREGADPVLLYGDLAATTCNLEDLCTEVGHWVNGGDFPECQ